MQLTVAMNDERRLREILDEYFEEEDLKTLAFDLGVRYDDLPAQGATNKARELVIYLKQRDRLPELAEAIQNARPNLEVPKLQLAPRPPASSAARKLDRVALVAVAVALILAGVAATIFLWPKPGKLSLDDARDYHFALTLSETCPDGLKELPAPVMEIVNGDDRGRTVEFIDPGERADLFLDLSCSQEEYVLTTRWENRAPIFEIVGSPVEFSILFPPADMADLNRLARAMIYYGTNDYHLARDVLSELLDDFQKDELKWLYANSLLLTGQYELAVSTYDDLESRMMEDALAQVYNNRGLAHLDEYWRQEQEEDNVPFETLEAIKERAMADFGRAREAGAMSPDVQTLVNSTAGVAYAMFDYGDKGEEACGDALAAEEIDSAWANVCYAAFLIEPFYVTATPCSPDALATAGEYLRQAEAQRPDLAAIYYWQALIPALPVFFDNCTSTEDLADYERRCEARFATINLLRDRGFAPLYFHQYLINLFPICVEVRRDQS